MKLSPSTLAAAAIAFSSQLAGVRAHYNFPELIVGGTNTSAWQYVRQTNNWQDFNPQTNVTAPDIRCYDSKMSGTSSTANVNAGDTIGFTIVGTPSNLYHPGVVNVYMAKAPTGTDVSKWDPTGAVWFKVYQISAITDGGSTITWPALNLPEIKFQIPAQTPAGQYLVRTEHIALHGAQALGGAQFYIACAQVNVAKGGSGTPGPLVAFPGAYTGNEPGIFINIYWPIPPTYTQPGPPVWPATGSSSGGSTTTTTKAAAPPATTSSTAKPPVTSTTAAAPPTGSSAAQYAQCGGMGWTGPTSCVAPYTCTAQGQYYSQCL
ncbi:unnamed protein product [Mycena citricolor]|uniref:lytic cellulose monooxygenase (C4-dehydrogenating) n=1 Tax=Mycena citricolor TaxID=2018698 RepID=A0AAD2HYJ5_9AGAR|nr:unnamed protein product [Mycena citricolor]